MSEALEPEKVTIPDALDPKVLLVPTQVRKPWTATVRTIFQLLIGIAAALPLFLTGVPVAGVPVVLAVAAVITRGMANPRVEEILSKYVPWLSAGGNK